MKNLWYAYVSWGSDPTPARGPFRSAEEANAAMERFHCRHGHMSDTWLESGSVRLAGPFATRKAAREADISRPNW